MCSRAQLDETYSFLDRLCEIVQQPQQKDVSLLQNIASYRETIQQAASLNESDIKDQIAEFEEKVKT